MPEVELEYVDSDSEASGEEIFYDVESYVLHKAVFHNNITQLIDLLKQKVYDLSEKDPHGNTPLHISIMMGHKECTKLLLTHDAPVALKNNLGWNCLAESISFGDREVITMCLKKLKKQSRIRIEEKQPDLTNALAEIADFYVEIKWDFNSWIPLISRFLPSDTCKLYKRNSDVRIDSTLMDFHDMRWQRGDLSFIFHGSPKNAKVSANGRKKREMYVLDNKAKKYSHISAVETDKDIEEEVDILMSSDIVSANISTKPITFSRLQGGWVYKHDKSEEVGDFTTSVFGVNGMVLNSRKRREHLSKEDVMKNKAALESISKGSIQWLQQQEELPRGRGSLMPPPKPTMTWDEYLNSPLEGDQKGRHLGRPIQLKQDKKALKASIWMTEDFPVKVEILLSILEVMAPFKHFSKLKDFINMKIPPGFPVKVEVPVLPTIAATVTFQSYREAEHDSKMFEIPSNYFEDSAHFSNM
ncbi:hypothetical protein ACHWQZ_G015896 [Mnemiopsis leidyi]